ncbi:tripartite tricarboxylate transporter substrate binding protein [Pseudoroseomonas wenyumeiae]|uniref:Tripartite tricarboxylate transporter substrate binding protein n=1 Tax=Teichococcus wenyumeiae TaxID=2478470 RepID=A0A3A9JLX1_9PROT|nr:tripartite tricarboxylate transporter substrate-binding protein [Pseudoroseomonas wenyumeiae]RKK05773.1 tripartite tricarboxylate transporter substrate binding protein [Pseudoroseomonas wenyumeiae]RMI24987.1 tripartite tricarboxylate transporter substrate binding protein [Pseudoroseomonas wenyumeiae]
MLKRRDLALLLGAAGMAAARPARAQPEFPARAVQLVVPYAAGGPTDIFARSISQPLAAVWKHGVVVDNRPGGGTMIGTANAAQAAPDGYTLLLTAFGFVMNPLMMRDLTFDPNAMVPIAQIGVSVGVLYVRKDLPASNLQEFIAYAKRTRGGVSFGSSGVGSSTHTAAEMLASQAGFQMTHVPYRGSAPAITDLMAGNVDAVFDTAGTMSFVREGKLKVLASGRATRGTDMPDVPTIRESGVPMDSETWYGFIGPKGLPEALRDRIARDVRTAVEDPATQEKLMRGGLEPRYLGPTEFTAKLASERAAWGKLVKERNLRLD